MNREARKRQAVLVVKRGRASGHVVREARRLYARALKVEHREVAEAKKPRPSYIGLLSRNLHTVRKTLWRPGIK